MGTRTVTHAADHQADTVIVTHVRVPKKMIPSGASIVSPASAPVCPSAAPRGEALYRMTIVGVAGIQGYARNQNIFARAAFRELIRTRVIRRQPRSTLEGGWEGVSIERVVREPCASPTN